MQDGQIVLSGSRVYVLIPSNPGQLLAGTSAGVSTEPLPAACDGQDLPLALAASTPEHLVLVCSGNDEVEPPGSVLVMLSGDGGRCWRETPATPPIAHGITSLATASGDTFVGTDDAGVWVSRNNGGSWSQDLWPSGSPIYIGFEDASHGLVLDSAGELYSTSDAGDTWTSSQIPAAS